MANDVTLESAEQILSAAKKRRRKSTPKWILQWWTQEEILRLLHAWTAPG